MKIEKNIKNFYGKYLISIKKLDEEYEDKYGKWIGMYEVKYYDINGNECNDRWYCHEKNNSIFYAKGDRLFSEYYYINENNELDETDINGLLYYLGSYDEVMCFFKKYEDGIFYLGVVFTDEVIKIPIEMLRCRTLERVVKLGDLFTKDEIKKLLK